MHNMQTQQINHYFEYYQLYEQNVAEAASFLKAQLAELQFPTPEFGITLGSGLGNVADTMTIVKTIPYAEIPNFPVPTVVGHEGSLLIGTLAGVPVIGLKGRTHYYELAHEPFNVGMLKTVFAVHVLAELGVANYFVTNAAGGLNPQFAVGDVMCIDSHINFLPNVLLGQHRTFTRLSENTTQTSEQVWRFQPMNNAYDNSYRQILLNANQEFAANLHSGVYLAVTGPTYETEGECLAFRDGLGADAVGMSTTSEVIVARNRNLRVVGLSCITNTITKAGVNATNHEEVAQILNSDTVKTRLAKIVYNFFAEFATIQAPARD